MTRHVYVIASDPGPVKIGIATDVESRFSALKTSSPFPMKLVAAITVPKGAAPRIERLAHEYLAEHRMTGEWFNLDPDQAVDAVIRAADAVGEGFEEYAPVRRSHRQLSGIYTEKVVARFSGPLKTALDEFCEAKGGISRPDAIRMMLQAHMDKNPDGVQRHG